MNSSIIRLVLGLTFVCSGALAQDNAIPPRKLRPDYVQVGFGLNKGSIRDFATSPVTYKGLQISYSLARLRMDTVKEVKTTLRFINGTYRFRNTAGTEVKSRATLYALYANYYRMYRLNGLSNSKWNFKLGGMADVNMDVRTNNDLMNAGVGYEVFNTFFLSGKVTHQYRQAEETKKKFLFIRYKARPHVSLWSYQINLPVMNNSIRNGFAYIGNESLDTFPLFKDYKVRAFSGTRFCSELAYTRQMQNGNLWRVSYLWDAYAAGKSFNRFEMANHIVEFSLLFHMDKTMQ